MSFNTALSGLNAAQTDLNVTSNNIANVNTTGFKESRAEFVDVFASSLLSNTRTQVGNGVNTSDVAQQFNQGGVNATNNALDLAITGNGFFAIQPELDSSEVSYTRAGEFKLDDNNFVVNSAGEFLLGFPVNDDGTSASVSLSSTEPVVIPSSSGSPSATTEIDIDVSLPAAEIAITDAPGNFDPTEGNTFSYSTSLNIVDSLGVEHTQTFFFVKDSVPNEWSLFITIDGQTVNIADSGDPDQPRGGDVSGGLAAGGGVLGARLVFDSSGDFRSQIPDLLAGGITTEALGLSGVTGGADGNQTVTIDFNLDSVNETDDEPSQFAGPFSVDGLSQDGLTVGRLTGIDIGDDGLLQATFSNGTSEPLSRIALASFANEQGLTQIGGTQWRESILSGTALAGEANSGTFGAINSSSLEQSNVNLTVELIDLISAQRNFQANSRSLDVSNQLTQNILQIR